MIEGTRNERKLTRLEKVLSDLNWKLGWYCIKVGSADWQKKNYPEVRELTLREKVIFKVQDLLDVVEERVCDYEWEKWDKSGK